MKWTIQTNPCLVLSLYLFCQSLQSNIFCKINVPIQFASLNLPASAFILQNPHNNPPVPSLHLASFSLAVTSLNLPRCSAPYKVAQCPEPSHKTTPSPQPIWLSFPLTLTRFSLTASSCKTLHIHLRVL